MAAPGVSRLATGFPLLLSLGALAAGSFLDLCYTPELAAEVTLQPVRRFGFDAAILFADILLVPHALGLELSFVEREGPRLAWPGGRIEAAALRPAEEVDATLSPVYATVDVERHHLLRADLQVSAPEPLSTAAPRLD